MTATAASESLFAHNVFFALHDSSAEACQRLLEACHRHLAPHPGIVFFGCGLRATDYHRPVNDTEFDVSLHLIFRDRAAHDSYQDTPAHHQFIAENKANWRTVRVFDALTAPAAS